jgi:tetratricopeptide (TPR) repeat protein
MRKAAAMLAMLLLSATAQDLLTLGDEFMRLGNWPVAINYFEQALKQNPLLGHGFYGKGLSLCQLGKFDEGISALSQAVELEPRNVEYLYVAGVCHEWKGKDNWKQAEAYYLRALKLAPGQAQLHHKLGSLYQHEGRCQDAIPEFQKALALNPGYFISYNNLGSCFLSLNRPQEAMRLFQQAIAHSSYPGEYHFYHHLGIAFLAAGRSEESKAAFVVETALNPDFPEAHLTLGNIYFLERNFARAIEEYQEVLSIDPEKADGHFNLGQLYLTIGQAGLAKKHFEQYVRLKPEEGRGHYFLGLCYSKLGSQGKAWEELNKSLELGYHPEPLRERMQEEKK